MFFCVCPKLLFFSQFLPVEISVISLSCPLPSIDSAPELPGAVNFEATGVSRIPKDNGMSGACGVFKGTHVSHETMMNPEDRGLPWICT